MRLNRLVSKMHRSRIRKEVEKGIRRNAVINTIKHTHVWKRRVDIDIIEV